MQTYLDNRVKLGGGGGSSRGKSGTSSAKTNNYLDRSLNQLVLGNYTDDVTLLGTGGEVALGLLGADLPLDIRDISADLVNWKWSWGHAGRTLLDVVAVVPVVGALKYSDEAAVLIKRGIGKPVNLSELEEIGGDNFATNIGKSISSGTNANSLSYKGTNYGYVLVDKGTNEILKFGESVHPNTRYSQSFLDANNATMKILDSGSKDYIHNWQFDMNSYYKWKYGNYPPLNSKGW